MQRRAFIKDTTTVVIAMSAFGSIRSEDHHFIGDSPTTTDILGPYYRPGAPLRTNINPPGFSGEPLHLSGIVFKEDGSTPFSGCLVEIWQCDNNQQYDNTSDDYRYRGAQRTDARGRYHFITTQPVPYPIAAGSPVYRPAHIHLRIAGEDQQDLITQIYFKGDRLIERDAAASAPTAVRRILRVGENSRKEKALQFNVVLAKEYKPTDEVFSKLVGLYQMNDRSTIELYREGDLLFMKWNGQIREALRYQGNNAFCGGVNGITTAKFELLPNQQVKLKLHFNAPALNKAFDLEGIKAFKY